MVNNSSSKYPLKVINNIFISHMCWINDTKIFYFGDSVNGSRGYYIYDILRDKSEKVMDKNLNDGHPSVDVTRKWIILDSYPNKKYNSYLYLYNIEKMEIVDVGVFKSNINLHGYNRCDLHPRWNNKGTKVMIDSSHNGKRYPVVIDLSEIVSE